ncbi:MAG: type II secretion system protein [Planctomycetota bacterium]|nr:type II secretion system protein [Planctomycetota bacterium]
MHAANGSTRRTGSRGFTLLEVIVVVAILALLATLTVPRVTGMARREFDLTVDRVADLLMMFAHRDNLGQKPVGIMYDESRRALMLVVLDIDDPEQRHSATWQIDRYVDPVKLPDIVDATSLVATADGEMAYIADYPLSHTPGEARPTIEIYFQSYDGEYSSTLVLQPYDVAPKRLDRSRQAQARMPIDLDAAGRSREDW